MGSGVYVQFTSVFIVDVYLPLVVSPTIDRASVCVLGCGIISLEMVVLRNTVWIFSTLCSFALGKLSIQIT